MLFLLNADVVSIIIDILVVLVILVVGLVSAKKGFVECLFGFLATIAAIVLAFLLMKPITSWTGGLFGLEGVLGNACTGVFAKVKPFTIDISNQGISEALAGQKLPQFLIDTIIKEWGNASIPHGTTIAILAGDALGGFITGLIVWVLLFVLGKLLMSLLGKVIGGVVSAIPIVGGLNRLLGFALGLIQGTLIISGIIAVISILPIPNATMFFNNGLLIKLLYNHNPLNVILGWILV
jgi:uncharacterized membrane protein required for colicin V production